MEVKKIYNIELNHDEFVRLLVAVRDPNYSWSELAEFICQRTKVKL